MQEIMDWSDYYTENCSENPNSPDSVTMLNLITDLWIAFAHFESNLKQFKNAVEVYDKATSDPYVGKTGRIYQSFSEYHVGRNKPGNAQKVLIRGLCAGLSEPDNKTLWQTLLDLTNKANNTQASFQQLFNVVVSQVPDASKLAPVPTVIVPTAQVAPPSNFRKEFFQDFAESKEDSFQQQQNLPKQNILPNQPQPQPSPIVQKTQPSIVPVAPRMEIPANNSSDDFDNLSGMNPEQVVHLFHDRPTMIFVAPNKEPMASGITNLTPQEVTQLETFLGIPLKDLSNYDENALHFPERKKAEFYLDIIEQLWNVQAMKERHFDGWMVELRRVHIAEEKVLLNRLRANPNYQNTNQDLFQTHEMKRFRKHCEVQSELLQAIINKIMFSILMEQEKLLSEMNFPFFSPNFYSQLINAYSMKRSSLLQKGKEGYLKEYAASGGHFFGEKIHQTLLSQQKILCAVFSLRYNGIQQNRLKLLTQQRSMSYAQQQQLQQRGINNFQQQQQPVMNQMPSSSFPRAMVETSQPMEQVPRQLQFAEQGVEMTRLPSDETDNAPGSARKRAKKRRRATGSNFGSHDEDMEEEDLSLQRQYSNTYSESSIDNYSESVFQNDVMMQHILSSDQPFPDQANMDLQEDGVNVGDNPVVDEEAANLFNELKAIIQK
jgi:hypothetical protein